MPMPLARLTRLATTALIGSTVVLTMLALPALAQYRNSTPNPVPWEMALMTKGTTEKYQSPNIKLMSQAFVKLTGVDLSDDKLVDDFAAINFCPAVRQFYTNEFKWREVREEVRKKIEADMETYPETILLHGTLKVGRYDFDESAFMLSDTSIMKNLGMFNLALGAGSDKPCQDYVVTRIPVRYNVRLNNPIDFDRIPMEEERAVKVLERLKTEKPGLSSSTQISAQQRMVYASFFIRINDFGLLRTGMNSSNANALATIRSTLVAMRLYEDQERTRLIYEYLPE
jgi:hypothetical protein